jgi:UDP-N-acetylmuramoylalanine--D-glutamate ligase
MDTALSGKPVLVVGMARSGLAAARFLRDRGAEVSVSDHRPKERLSSEIQQIEALGARWEAGGHTDDFFSKAELIVVSPGVPLSIPVLQCAREAGREIISEIELASRYLRGKILAITGTNGKTTTTALAAEILKTAGFRVQVGGNIGTALISLVEFSSPETWNVVEVSSFQLEAVQAWRPDIAVILNVTPDHLDRYRSVETYAQAKFNLFQNQTDRDFAVLNQEDNRLQAVAGRLHSQVFWFSGTREVPAGTYAHSGQLVFKSDRGRELVLRCDEVPLKGGHNIENVAAAITAARLAGVPSVRIAEGIRNFKAVEHRLEPVAEIAGVHFYNDSKATNVDATVKALRAFDSGVILILGGRDKGGDFAVLAPLVRERVKSLVLLGEASNKIRAQLAGTTMIVQADSMEAAVGLAFQQSRPGDTILLAPACASFDMFENYEQRGKEFKAAVGRLVKKPEGHN